MPDPEIKQQSSFTFFDGVRVVLIILFIAGFVYYMSRDDKTQTIEEELEHWEFSGTSMGTYYMIQVSADLDEKVWQTLSTESSDKIDEIDRLMSTYREESDVSKFNASPSTDWFSVSAQTAKVVQIAQETSKLTDGAFDITVGPLVNRWQFGPEKDENSSIPSKEEIEQLMKRIGYKHLECRLDPPALKKDIPDLYIDLSGIAKGFAVDAAIADLTSKTVKVDKKDVVISNLLVDIGGETYAAGKVKPDRNWELGIAKPIDNIFAFQTHLPLENMAMATSGGYRNYHDFGPLRFSHIIDPRTGGPTEWLPEGAPEPHERIASATVIDTTCARADALATGLFVLGPGKGIELAEKEKLAVLYLMRKNDGTIREIPSKKFKEMSALAK